MTLIGPLFVQYFYALNHYCPMFGNIFGIFLMSSNALYYERSENLVLRSDVTLQNKYFGCHRCTMEAKMKEICLCFFTVLNVKSRNNVSYKPFCFISKSIEAKLSRPSGRKKRTHTYISTPRISCKATLN